MLIYLKVLRGAEGNKTYTMSNKEKVEFFQRNLEVLSDWGFTNLSTDWLPLGEEDNPPVFNISSIDVGKGMIVFNEVFSSLKILEDILNKLQELANTYDIKLCLLWVESCKAFEMKDFEFVTKEDGKEVIMPKNNSSHSCCEIFFNVQKINIQ